MTKTNKTIEEYKVRMQIPSWMRDKMGIGDGDTFTAEEVQDTLECFFDDFIQSEKEQALKERTEEIIKIVKTLSEDIDYTNPQGIMLVRWDRAFNLVTKLESKYLTPDNQKGEK